jgi:microcystin-dependent protein
MEAFVGTILTFGFNFAPSQWALCNGQTIAISQNQALFALLGTVYGGNGVSTFQLPNLQSRSPIGFGQGLGLSPYVLGQAAGTEQVSLLISNMPTHTHVATFTPSGGGSAPTVTINAASAGTATGTVSATNNYLTGSGGTTGHIWTGAQGANPVPIGGVTVTGGGGGGGTVTNATTGQGLPTAIMNPYLAVNFSISLFGIFPTRN